MKGEESVDDVTEADRPGVLGSGWRVVRKSVFMRDRRERGLALCAAVMRSLRVERPVIKREVRASGGCLGTERR